MEKEDERMKPEDWKQLSELVRSCGCFLMTVPIGLAGLVLLYFILGGLWVKLFG